MNLLITQWLWFGIAGFVILFGISVVAWALSSAECFEHEDDPVPPLDDHETITFQQVIDSERPYISLQ